ncbi:MAG: hypothetical protein SFX74_00460 [Fimbriimonadaceae bacterium]|nr:hypothetical protein [Fimbriimonadaceae bacterium]
MARVSFRPVPFVTSLVLAGLGAPSVHAHFLWMYFDTPTSGGAKVVFAESPGNSVLPNLVGKRAQFLLVQPAGLVGWGDEYGAVPADGGDVALGKLPYGVMTKRGGFLLMYYARATRDAVAAAGPSSLPLDLLLTRDGEFVQLQVLFRGEPRAGAKIQAYDAAFRPITATADAEGRARLRWPANRPFFGWASTDEKRPGTFNGKAYPFVRHYTSLSVSTSGK